MSRINGTNVVLRELRKEDFEAIHSWMNNPEITANLSERFYPPRTFYSTEELLNSIYQGRDTWKVHYFVIERKSDNEPIGVILLFDINWIYRSAELAIVIGNTENHGRGYGQESIKLVLDYAFDKANLHRVELRVHENNAMGINCYGKCGFVEEGRLRKSIYKEGRYFDMILMGILAEER